MKNTKFTNVVIDLASKKIEVVHLPTPTTGGEGAQGRRSSRSAPSPRLRDDQKTRPADFSIFHNFTTAVY